MSALTPVTVEMAPGADLSASPSTWSWVDITAYVDLDDSGVPIVHAMRDESSVADATTATLRLNNRDGRFSPENPLGPWYGQIDDGTPVRILWRGKARFEGFMFGLPTRWDRSGTDSWVPVECADILRLLAQRKKPVHDPLRRFIEQHRDAVLGYWPLNDDAPTAEDKTSTEGVVRAVYGPDAVVNYFEVDGSRGPVTSRPQFGQPLAPWLPPGIQIESVAQEPDLLGVSGSALIQVREVSAQPPTEWAVDYMCRGNPNGAPPRVSAGIIGRAGLIVPYFFDLTVAEVTRKINLVLFDDAGVREDSSLVDAPELWNDDRPHHVRVQGVNVNGRVRIDVYIDGDLRISHLSPDDPPFPVSQVMVGLLPTALGNFEFIGPGNKVILGQVVFWGPGAPSISDTVAAAFGHPGEPAGRRLERLCAERGIPFSYEGDLDETEPMGPQTPAPFLELLRECEAVDGGIMYGRGFGIHYRTRASLYSQSVAWSIPVTLVDEPPQPIRDDALTRNEVTVRRTMGGEVTVSDAEHIARHGLYDEDVQLNVAGKGRLPDVAGWRLHLGTGQRFRWPVISLRLHDDMPEVDEWFGVEVGDRVVLDLAAYKTWPGLAADILVVGWTETLRLSDVAVELRGLPAEPWSVARVVADGGVQFVGATLTQEGLTGVEPAGVQPGDLLVALTMNDGAPLTGPAGWTLQAQVQGGDFGTVSQVWTLVRGTSPPDLEWSSTAPDFPVVAVHAWRHAELISPVLAVAESTVAPSQTAPSSGATLVCLYTDSSWQAVQEPPGMTRRDVAGAFSDQLIVAEQRVGAGPTGTREFVGADPSGAFSLLLGSATPPPGPGDPVRVDTAGCETLAPFVAGTETTLDVATLAGPVWTSDPADLPMDIDAAGARMRVTAVAPGVVEEFTGTAVDGWGATDTGQPWTTLGGDPSDYAKGSGVGTMRETDPGGPTRRALLDGMPADLEVLWAASVPEVSSGTAAQVAVLCREHNDNADFIAFRLVLLTNGNVDARISIRQSGVETTLANPSGVQATYAGGTVLWCRCRAQGAQLLMRCWADGDPEPTIWQAVATDPAFVGVAGRAGLRAALDPGWTGTLPYVFSFHHFEVTTVQRFTVEQQPINGVRKVIPPGTPVRLWTPARIGL